MAKELTIELKQDMQCKIEIDDMEGIFPTITPFGMAALLPNKGLKAEVRNNNLKVLIDGELTDMPNREKILKKANKDSRVLKYDNLIHMKKEERKTHVKGMDVIYIYHNQIDGASHTSDSKVFSACDKAIDEIKNLVRILSNDFSGVNIMITSDHGFLYTYEEFTEDDKVAKDGFEGLVDFGRRYAIMDESANPNFLMPIKFIDEESRLKGFAPKDNIRIKKQGGGINFVHGGISLQEKVSDEVRIIADKNTDNQQDRVFNVKFNLKAGKYDNKKTYNLIIYEESGQILPKKIEFVIDIPFAIGEYDFFS